jgi:restriction system protein
LGAIWFKRAELIGHTTELVGYKSGLALTRERAGELLGADFNEYWDGDDESILRVRSEEFEALFIKLLYEVGATASPSPMPFSIALYHKYKADPESLEIYKGVGELFAPAMHKAMDSAEKQGKRAIDPREFIEQSKELFGARGALIAIEFLEGANEDLFRSPWGGIRRVDWKDTAELEELFRSESLQTQYGTFIDQRFIDYLARNFENVDEMNWRKFEGLAAEFFSRLGWQVEIGPGRNDGGIDIRVWSPGSADMPPVILVQCKRQKDKIGKTVVKALHADITAENAEIGLIVTTSSLSPGARKVVTSRSYAVREADRPKLEQWITAMRTPQAGAFLAE